jgi:hypothetical protein
MKWRVATLLDCGRVLTLGGPGSSNTPSGLRFGDAGPILAGRSPLSDPPASDEGAQAGFARHKSASRSKKVRGGNGKSRSAGTSSAGPISNFPTTLRSDGTGLITIIPPVLQFQPQPLCMPSLATIEVRCRHVFVRLWVCPQDP